MKLPRPLSHSSISLYAECPQKYKFKYVDKVPEKPRHFFSFGQSVHTALEYFYGVTTPVPPTLEAVLAHYREKWVSAGYKSEEQEQEYFELGRGIIARFHDKHAKDFALPFSVEYAFNFEVDGVPVTGRIDRVDKLPDGRLRVLDYKTGKQLQVGRIDTDAQLTMYQLACERQLGVEVSELIFYHLPTLKQHTAFRRPAALVDELKSRIVHTAESIVKERFDPAPEETKCKWCDYKPICPIFKGVGVGPSSWGAPAAAAMDAELAALVDRAGEARARAAAAKAEADAAAAELGAAMSKRGYVRAFGERHEVTAAPAVRWEFLDKKKVLALIKDAGLYEKVLAPSAPLVNKLVEDPRTDGDLRAKLSELGERVESSELSFKPL
ncbi:MAG: PD-(D/E)XK nuclease family protein [Elusimicrobiota bacterium]|nr:PD-(D/E)XK nuclease family protein [Elusimicrobiota bacterium]